MTNKYDDIIHLPHHVSTKRPHMAIIDRAAQFSPFAALTGHSAAVNETARLTDKRIELDEYMKNALNERLRILSCRLKELPEVEITYFKPDNKKDGGTYATVIDTIKKIDEYERIIVLNDGLMIPIDEIINIDGEVF